MAWRQVSSADCLTSRRTRWGRDLSWTEKQKIKCRLAGQLLSKLQESTLPGCHPCELIRRMEDFAGGEGVG